MRLSSSRATSLAHRPQQDFPLWDKAGTRPSLDLQFADRKDLVDATTGSNLVDHTRASSGTYVGSDGLIKTATTNLLLQSEDFSTTWSIVGGTVTSNAASAPNGTNTAELLTATSTGAYQSRLVQSISNLSTQNYTLSCYAKPNNTDFLAIRFVDGGSGNSSGYFNLLTGQTSSIDTVWTTTAISATAVGEGWYRCVISFTVSATDGSADVFIYCPNSLSTNDVNTGNSIYIWGAQLEQSDTVGEYVKTTSTINSAPRFNHEPTTGESLGLLVEESRTNLLLRSEEFDNASWQVGMSGLTVTANTVVAPDGQTTGDVLTNSATPTGARLRYNFTFTAASHTGSLYAKAATGTQWVKFWLFDGASNYESWHLLTTSWQRIAITGATAAGNGAVLFGAVTASGSSTYQADAVVHIWGAQLEAGSFPTSYIPTTTAAVTRAADVASISDSNFSSWYRQDEGTVFGDTQYIEGTRVIGFNDGTNDNRIEVFQTGTTSVLFNRVSASNVVSIGSNGFKFAAAMKQDDFALSCLGAAVVTDNSGGMPVTSQANIGSWYNGTGQLNGTIRRLTYWPVRLENNVLQAITQ